MEKNEIAEKNTILEAEVEKLLKRNESLYRGNHFNQIMN